MSDYYGDLQNHSRQRAVVHRVACYTFIVTILLLYISNFILRTFVFQDTFWELIRDFLLPVVLIVVIYAVDWKQGYISKFLCNQLPAVPMTSLVALVIATFIACILNVSNRDSTDFGITILSSLAMATVPYALRNIQRASCVIVLEAIVFILLAARLGYNAAAIVTIFTVATMLILALPKLGWFNGPETYIKQKTQLALVMLLLAFLTVILVEDTQVMQSFFVCSLGRPGLGSSAIVNNACMDILLHARWFGSTGCGYPLDSIFSNRIYTYILGTLGWGGVLPLLLVVALMIMSGIYISQSSIRIERHFAVVFLTIISVQTIGYILMCAGLDSFLFPEVAPFLDGGFGPNTLFLFMATKILPPKQVELPDDIFNNIELKMDDNKEDNEKKKISLYILPERKKEVTMQSIIEVVAEYYMISAEQIISKNRDKKLMKARRVAIYLCTEIIKLPLDLIGETFGNRDYSTVLYARNKISKDIKSDNQLCAEIEVIKKKIL